jgi:hypothetical protein
VPAKKSPDNADIITLININHEETIRRLSAVEDQVKKTNGRVSKLEVDASTAVAVANALEKAQSHQMPTVGRADKVVYENNEWTAKKIALAGAAATFLTAVAAYIGGRAL